MADSCIFGVPGQVVLLEPLCFLKWVILILCIYMPFTTKPYNKRCSFVIINEFFLALGYQAVHCVLYITNLFISFKVSCR